MKNIFKNIGAIGALCLVFLSGCKKDKTDSLNTTIDAAVLSAPVDNTVINLTPFLNAVVNFEWKPAKVGNNVPSFYEVQFDKATGDFSSPVYKEQSARGGGDSKLSINHRIVNRIAKAAGIEELASGKVKWRVVANTGVVSAVSGTGVLELKRPAGLADNPADVYILGTATEAGEDLTKALKFKKLSDGVFEIYTSLNAGTYKMVDKTTGTPVTFVLSGNLITEAASANSPATTKTVYRINLDFNYASAVVTEIVSVGLWFSGYNAIKANLVYDAAGGWKATFNNAWKVESTFKDERYKFRVVEKNAAGISVTKNWGSSKQDNVRPTANQDPTYFLLKEVNNSQYDFSYKFQLESANTEVVFKMQSSADYTHVITYK
ncbi:hypothetical protein FBD94_12005 [Pedobacter hiemivivus]|uniref:SusE outer membrane protein domain-containing protein n=1 Tax=Pedobacter hiemivivus TaxID=2530454 RepID=A0A4U1GBE1_9SPHI|nr:SusE domain-containing protein [Pedobacter hiemivivus]TKC61261.1 hypothetical protein FBD94_12005 [Pedobacter hiemivivus]